MHRLKAIMERCKCGVSVEINEHRPYHASVDEYYGTWRKDTEVLDEIWDVMVNTDTAVWVQFFPDSSCGSYTIIHHNLDKALDEAIRILEEEAC